MNERKNESTNNDKQQTNKNMYPKIIDDKILYKIVS